MFITLTYVSRGKPYSLNQPIESCKQIGIRTISMWVSKGKVGKLSTCEHRSGCPSPSRSELGQTHFSLCRARHTSSTTSLLPSQHCRYPFIHLGGEE